MKKVLVSVLAAILVLFIPRTSHAETHVFADDIKEDSSWNEEGSPYLLEEPIYVSDASILRIGPGVSVTSVSATDQINSITCDGVCEFVGTKEKPIRFTGMDALYFSTGEAVIKHVDLEATGLNFEKVSATLESVRISDAFEGISAKGSTLTISDSVLSKNEYGIASYEQRAAPAPMLAASVAKSVQQNIISIHDSVISGNRQFGVLNSTQNTIDASDNWWGGAEGPNFGDKVKGPVETVPWKTEDPSETSCCSNVLFLPGIEASRLFKEVRSAFGTTSVRLWEPSSNGDMSSLAMNGYGKSVESKIYPEGIIESAYGIKDIYASWSAALNGLVSKGVINEWKPYAYDWRFDIEEISGDSLMREAYRLASTSRSGKVVIVAHSNGGLVAKALLKRLEESGRSSLVEQSMLIAVPELGTPQALLALLHGYGQSIAGGLVLSENTVRNFSRNVPGAYGLLPSPEFFKGNPLSVIIDHFSSSGPVPIASYADMRRFLENNSFSRNSSDTSVPIRLNPYLISSAQDIHSALDIWKPATTTKITSVLGWGMPTVKGVVYEKDAHCMSSAIRTCPVAFSPNITHSGDGTVITKSASGILGDTVFFNLKKLKDFTKKGAGHADIMKASALQSFVFDSLAKSSDNSLDYKEYLTSSEPLDTTRWLTIRVHSPIDLHIYDKEGNHTGPLDAVSTSTRLEDYESEIAGSYYGDFGRVKMAVVPYGEQYQIFLKGTGSGVFSVDAEITYQDTVIATTSFPEMSVTPRMQAEIAFATSTDLFATSSVMYIDTNGDGTTEHIQKAGKMPDKKLYKRRLFDGRWWKRLFRWHY